MSPVSSLACVVGTHHNADGNKLLAYEYIYIRGIACIYPVKMPETSHFKMTPCQKYWEKTISLTYRMLTG